MLRHSLYAILFSFFRENTLLNLTLEILIAYIPSNNKNNRMFYRIVSYGIARLHQNTTLRENIISKTHKVNQNFSAMLHLAAVYL